jgi:hypothetical protein
MAVSRSDLGRSIAWWSADGSNRLSHPPTHFDSKRECASSSLFGVAIERLQPGSFLLHPALPGEAPA